MSTEKAFNLAMQNWGTEAIPGGQSNPAVLAYFKDAGHPEIKDDDTPWCAAFLNAMLKRCGLPTTGSLAARSFLTWGVPTVSPQLGDVVVLWRGTKDGPFGHVGFVTAVYKNWVYVLGGNEANKVEIAPFDTAHVLQYRRLG